MKAKKSLLVLALTFVAAGALSACGGENNSTDDKKNEDNTIRIQFVPSTDPGKLATLAKNMEPLLAKYSPDYKFEITTGTSYAATTTAMLSDQIDIGFLTASGYAEATIKNPGKVEVLYTSVRKGYKVQVEDYDTPEDQMKAMNGEIEGYEYLGQQSDMDVNWYTSQLTVANEHYVDANGDGKINVHDLIGKTVAIQGATSGAGYLRPLEYLHNEGIKLVEQFTPGATNEIRGVYIKGYPAACTAMMNGDVAGFWGFTDVRYANFYSKTDSEYYQDARIFTESKVIAMASKIYNDTISARSNLSQAKKDAVKHAFAKLVKDGDINTEGTGAYYLYNLYSHTGYTEAKDSDFDGERAFYNFCVENNLI